MSFVEHEVTDPVTGAATRERMARDLGRVATPAVVVGERVFWGFADNSRDIADLLGLRLPNESEPGAAGDSDSEPLGSGVRDGFGDPA